MSDLNDHELIVTQHRDHVLIQELEKECTLLREQLREAQEEIAVLESYKINAAHATKLDSLEYEDLSADRDRHACNAVELLRRAEAAELQHQQDIARMSKILELLIQVDTFEGIETKYLREAIAILTPEL